MPEQKISLARVVLLLSVIVSISAVLGILLIAGKIEKNNRLAAVIPSIEPTPVASLTKNEIVILTDKAEYFSGEYVKLNIVNKLKEPIWYLGYCAKPPLEIYEYQNGEWKKIDKTSVASCLNSDWVEKIEAGETKNIDYFYEGLFEAGKKYKIGLRYGAKELVNENSQLDNEEIVYSNEFAVRAKTEIIIATDKTEYVKGETVKILMKNNSSKKYSVLFPFYGIERKDGEEWKAVITSICSCSQIRCESLPSPDLSPEKTIEEKWNQAIIDCENNATINQVANGSYRVKVSLWDGKEITVVHSKEFAIKF